MAHTAELYPVHLSYRLGQLYQAHVVEIVCLLNEAARPLLQSLHNGFH